jgi:hypothetical protein
MFADPLPRRIGHAQPLNIGARDWRSFMLWAAMWDGRAGSSLKRFVQSIL